MGKEDMIIARLDRMEQKLDVCVVEIATLKVKSAVWGALAGLVPVVIGLGMYILTVA